jgi:hypothetical protein
MVIDVPQMWSGVLKTLREVMNPADNNFGIAKHR